MIKPVSLSEQLLFSTIRIKTEYEDNSRGYGTGFLYQYKYKNLHLVMIITNKHVVENSKIGQLVFHLGKKEADQNSPSDEKTEFTIHNFESRWIPHPDDNVDLCAMPLSEILKATQDNNIQLFYITLDQSLILTDEELTKLSAIEDVIMLGYPIGLIDSTNNLPIIRQGCTATHPGVNFQGKNEFMIDMAVFPGSSGSPVLLFTEHGFGDKYGSGYTLGSRAKLLGILYAGPVLSLTGELVTINVPVSKKKVPEINVMTNLGRVIKAKELFPLCNQVAVYGEKNGWW